MTQKKHNRLTEEDPEATVHLAEIQAMLDAGIPVYIEINAEIRAMLDADMKTMAGDIIKLTRNSITDSFGIPMIKEQGYLWSTDTYRAIIRVEDVGNSSGCSKCIFDKYDCYYIDCFNSYYEYRQVITDEDCAPVEIMCTETDFETHYSARVPQYEVRAIEEARKRSQVYNQERWGGHCRGYGVRPKTASFR